MSPGRRARVASSRWPDEALDALAPSTDGSPRARPVPRLPRGVDPFAPRRWLLRRLGLGRTLHLGCGAGNDLLWLPSGSVGVDPDPDAVAAARAAGGFALSPDDFDRSAYARPGCFDSLLLIDVVQRLSVAVAATLIERHLLHLVPPTRVALIAPQEAAQRADAAAVALADFDRLDEIAARVGLRAELRESYPLPRAAGEHLVSNEFVAIYSRAAPTGNA